MGIRVPSLDEDDRDPWALSPSRAPKTTPIEGELPERLEVVSELPVSPVGKILKRQLREAIALKLQQEQKP